MTNKRKYKKKIPTRSDFDLASFKGGNWSNERDFLEHVGISKKKLSAANISWQELAAIYIDHETSIDSLRSLANTVAQMLQQNTYVNSIRTRVKDPKKLVDKIIRKRGEKGKNINFTNYKEEISDLVGVRVLHILKKDWLPIHLSILNTFKLHNKSTPIAYITRSDETLWKPLYTDNGCTCETNDRDYKSVHYDIEIGFTKQKTRLEIQVRTINEEAWGELDHKINYPAPALKVVGDFIRAANMLSSTADHLSQHIILVNSELSQMMEDQKQLKLERDVALKEAKELLSKLAKTKEEKEQVKKALEDLERTTKARAVSSVSFSSSKISNPLTFSLTSPSIVSYDGTHDSTNYLLSSSLKTNKCKHCQTDLGYFSLSEICNACILKGDI